MTEFNADHTLALPSGVCILVGECNPNEVTHGYE